MSCDTNWSNVTVLLPLSAAPIQPTPTNAASWSPATVFSATPITLDTVNYQFAPASAKFVSGDFIDANSSIGSGTDFSSGDCTLEGWFYSTTGFSNNVLLAQTDFTQLSLFQSTTGSPALNGTVFGVTIGTNSCPINQWNHVAVVVSGATVTIYLNGVAVNSGAAVRNINWRSNGFYLGGTQFGASFVGNMQDIRLSNIARYTSNFTPPTAPFPTIPCAYMVPDVVGYTVSAATTALIAAGLVAGTVTTAYDLLIPAGDVISTNPVAGTAVGAGAAVDMVASLGPEPVVPDVTNKSIAVASVDIHAVGLVVGSVTIAPNAFIIPGNVISQSPAGGTLVPPGSAVNLVISSGLPHLLVPDLLGLTQAEAVTLLESLGLVPGAIGSAPSSFIESGLVQAQNPSAGNPVASGSIVSFVVSTGEPIPGTVFDFEATVISQYANSPTILQLVQNLNQYIDQSVNFANFFNYVWNVDTAVGFGLDIWGKIVNVSRLLQIPNTTLYVGFDNSATPPPDWQSMGSTQTVGGPVGGAMYTGHNATETYLLDDNSYRQLILAKAFANIAETTAPAINTILQNLYGQGAAWVLNTAPMAISYNLNFTPTAIQLAILQQSGVIPTPPGVAVTIVTP